jgi:hypothetical protein
MSFTLFSVNDIAVTERLLDAVLGTLTGTEIKNNFILECSFDGCHYFLDHMSYNRQIWTDLMQNYQYSICGKDMDFIHMIKYVDYNCYALYHALSLRIKDDQTIKLKLRFTFSREEVFLKIHYDIGYSEVWSDNAQQRLKINLIVPLDFSNIEKLKNKIKTLLIFA